MELTSLVVSILAFCAASAALFYARRETLATEAHAEEVARLQHERERPRLLATAEMHGSEPCLVITNAGLPVVERIQAQLRATKDDNNGNAKVRSLPETQTWNLASLDRFQGARTSIGLGTITAGHTALVVLTASRGAQTWEWIAEVPVP
jgi:hypothetical protein